MFADTCNVKAENNNLFSVYSLAFTRVCVLVMHIFISLNFQSCTAIVCRISLDISTSCESIGHYPVFKGTEEHRVPLLNF